jgi:uncharacterized protein YuzE
MEKILRHVDLQCDYDPDTDVAHIHVAEAATAHETKHTCTCDPEGEGGHVHLHFDEGGRLLRIEVLQAGRTLPVSLLQSLEH